MALEDLIHIHKMDIFPPRDFRRQEHVEPLDKMHDVAQIVARQKPSERILLRHHESQHEYRQLVRAVQLEDIGQIARQAVLRLHQERLMTGRVVRKAKISVAQDRSQGNVNDLKIILGHRRRRRGRSGIEIIQQNEIAPEGFVDPRRDFGKRLCQAAAHDQKALRGIGCYLQVNRRPIAGAIMAGKKSRGDSGHTGCRCWFRPRDRRVAYLRLMHWT